MQAMEVSSPAARAAVAPLGCVVCTVCEVIVVIEVIADDTGEVELSASVVCANVAEAARSRTRADKTRNAAVFIFDSLELATR